MRRASILALLTVLSSPCLAQSGAPAHVQRWPYKEVLRPADATPLQFLDTLRAQRDTPRGVLVMWPPPGWVRAEHVPALLALARSTEPVAVTCGVVAAHAVPLGVRSTLGREAMRLIEAYRRNWSSQDCSDVSVPGDPDELNRWWTGQGGAR